MARTRQAKPTAPPNGRLMEGRDGMTSTAPRPVHRNVEERRLQTDVSANIPYIAHLTPWRLLLCLPPWNDLSHGKSSSVLFVVCAWMGVW
jgi:hypothetical protein